MNAMGKGRYESSEIEALTRKVLTDGYCVLPGHFSPKVLNIWNAAFAPLLERHIAHEGELQNRGPARYYVTLPFTAPFNEPAFYEDEDVLSIVRGLVGDDPVMPQLATDTPVLGSEYQDIHRDAPPLFPETGAETPPFQLAINFPLVDVTQANGPFEIVPGTHMISKDEGLRRLASGEARIESLLMQLGDVMIRDVRCLHRGTPNLTGTPRPMVVIGYSRRWLFRPEVSIRVPRAALDTLSARARRLLRFNTVVESLDDQPDTEIYQAFAY